MSTSGDGDAKIMVVEDNDMLQGLLRRALERAGYEVISAMSDVEMLRLRRPKLPGREAHAGR